MSDVEFLRRTVDAQSRVLDAAEGVEAKMQREIDRLRAALQQITEGADCRDFQDEAFALRKIAREALTRS